MVTALCQFVFSAVMIVIIVKERMVEPWQYIAAFKDANRHLFYFL